MPQPALFDVAHGDSLRILPLVPDNHFDSIVCDPPYALTANKKGGTGEASLNLNSPAGRARISTGGGFMGKAWDSELPTVELWREALRVAKPGAYLAAFGGTRTYHRLACAIEDAGWEIRDCLSWMYGTGFPKSLDVSKAMDKSAGAERSEVIGTKLGRPGMAKDGSNQSFDSSINTYGGGGVLPTDILAPATDLAKQWQGWGTALKPAWEPIILARKPLVGTVAKNVAEHGTGGLNIDGCRIAATDGYTDNAVTQGINTARTSFDPRQERRTFEPATAGRWPANVVLDEEAAALLDEQSGTSKSTGGRVANISKSSAIYGGGKGLGQELDADAVRGDPGYGDTGGASRFFYCAKAGRKEREAGLAGMPERVVGTWGGDEDDLSAGKKSTIPRTNVHPTVKPVALMRWLCRLVTPPNGLVLDPFAGSGSTGIAAVAEGFRFLGIEKEAEYAEIARRRIEHWAAEAAE